MNPHPHPCHLFFQRITGTKLLTHHIFPSGEVLGSLRCDCGEQLRSALYTIAARGSGVVVFLRQEGRGIGLKQKLRLCIYGDGGVVREGGERLTRLFVVRAGHTTSRTRAMTRWRQTSCSATRCVSGPNYIYIIYTYVCVCVHLYIKP